jgi:nucleotide-binding universal stress UspA family protein
MNKPDGDAGSLLTASRVPRRNSAVVVGYDESPAAEAAVQWAADRAESLGMQLLVVYAANPPTPLPWTTGAGLPATSVLRHSAEKVARRAAANVRRSHPGLTVRSQGAVGSPAAELISLSDSAAFVVVGRRARPGYADHSVGSVSFALSAHARCPVVVVQGDHDGGNRETRSIVVGVDSSRASKRALSFAASLAQVDKAPLVVVSAWAAPRREPWMADLWEDPARTADLLAMEFERAQSTVNEAISLVHEEHPEVSTVARTPEGSPTEALLREAEPGSLVVVGSRGHGGFAGLMLGSVSRAVLRRAEMPVAVVRDGAF